jgi:cytochrome c553
LAMHCAICHDAVGNSDAVPKLAGQDQVAVFKELEDFKSGARSSAVMNPFAQHMTEQQVKDFAAYYAFLPPSSWSRPAAETAPHIIVYGAPMRGIAPCGACHGAIERKSGAPSLDGQPAAYIQSQLEGFANGARHNDINQQMRNIARGMTGEERNAVASYYAPRPLGQGPAEHNHP